ncbi:MAG: glycosyltransferase family 2 protein [Ruminococcus sp.]|nr:glycosyltransferase family 2 protein [Ruminococcus sp.]
MNVKISVIIATMNRLETLVETIHSLKQSSVFPEEVIVLDQSTIEETAESIRALTEKSGINIRYYHLDHPSLTHARNVGLQYANNDILIYMDDDVSVEKDTFQNICHMMEDKSIALIGGLDLLSGKGTNPFGYLFAFKSLFRKRYGGYVTSAMYGRYRSGFTDRVKTEWAMGYFFVIRKSLVERWDLEWDERFISYGYPEDLDFSYRYAKKAESESLSCVLDPAVSVAHRVSQEWRETKKAVTYMKIVNREYLTYKFEWPFFSRMVTRWSNFGLFVQRCIHRDRPMDVIKAQWFCDKYRHDIKKGIFHTELYT